MVPPLRRPTRSQCVTTPKVRAAGWNLRLASSFSTPRKGANLVARAAGQDYLQRHSFTARSWVPAVAKTVPSGEKT